jgi:hypothetical protein
MSPTLTITEEGIDRAGELENGSGYTATEDQAAVSTTIPSDWLPGVRLQLDAIEILPRGWDSYGSPSPDARIVEAGWALLLCLCEAGGLAKPHVNPTRSGGVQFEWEVGDRYFELEVVAERAATYLYCDDAAGVEESGEVFEEESLEAVLDYIRRVAAVQ